MRVRPLPLSTAVLTAALVAGAGSASAQQPAQRDTARAPRTTGTSTGEVVPGGIRVTKEVPSGTSTRPAPPTSAPSGGTMPGGTMPGGTMPGGTMPGGTMPGGTSPMAPRADSSAAAPGAMSPSASGSMSPSSMSPSGGMNASAMAGPEAASIVASLRSDANAMALLHESNLGEIQAGQRALREAADSAVRAYAQMMITEHTALDAQQMALGQRLGVAPALPDSQLPSLQQRELQALPAGAGGTGGTGGAMANPSTTPASGSALTGATPSTTAGGTSPASSPMPGAMDSTRATGGTAGTPGAMAGHAGHNMSAAGGTASGGANAFDRAYVAQQIVAHARTLQLVDAAIQRTQQAELRTMLESQVRPSVQAHLEQAQQIQQRIGNR